MKAPKLAAILGAVALAPTWVAAADKTDQSATSSTQLINQQLTLRSLINRCP